MSVFIKILILKRSKTLLCGCLSKHHWYQRCCSMRISRMLARGISCKKSPVQAFLKLWLWHGHCAEWQPLHKPAQAGLRKRTRKNWYFVKYISAGWLVLGNTVRPLLLWLVSLLHTYCLRINNVNFITWSDANRTTSNSCRSYTFMILTIIKFFIMIF